MRPARLIEWTAWIAGTVLLATYAGVKTWSARASEDGIAAMEEARALYAASVVKSPTGAPSSRPAAPSGKLDVAAPDTSLWNARRIEEYRAALDQKALPSGVLRIPKLNLEVPVYEGTSEITLNRGAGRIAGTAMIESGDGNIGIAAHRDGFFRPLKDIAVGDVLLLDTISQTREYRVERLDIVEPSDVSVLEPTDSATLTLVTCYPFYFVGSAPQRFIVRARIERSG